MQKYSTLPGGEAYPLCVDLDGTIVETDTFVEYLLIGIRKLSLLYRILWWAIEGKAKLKQELACNIKINPAMLPYNASLLQYLYSQRSIGRRLYLVTAANMQIAEEVNKHLGIFEEVIASNASRNLRGEEKGKALVARFGNRKFSYAGNDRTDLHVWKYAHSGVLVNTSNVTARRALDLTTIERRFDKNRLQQMGALLRSLRPHQWVKNLLVFVPIVTAKAYVDLGAILNAMILFVAFCSTSSGVYVLNDLFDIEADRRHPIKRERPFASGRLSIITGFAMLPFLFGGGFVFAYLTHVPAVLVLLLLYSLITIAYSIKLKELPLVDVFTLSGLYTIRMFSGGEVTNHHVSLWLLAYSGFIFLALAIIKRTAELKTKINGQNDQLERRGYASEDIYVIQSFGIASTFVSSVVMALYIQSQAAADIYYRPQILWFLVPAMLFWQCRLWLSTARGYMDYDPIVYSAKDWVSWVVALFVAAVLIAASVKF